MEFGLREVLIGVGLLVIAAILFDGFRRMRRTNGGTLDLPAEMGGSMDDDWEYYRGELPNGGARSVSLRKEPNMDDADDYVEESLRHEPRFEEEQIDVEPLYAEDDDHFEPQVSSARKVNEPDAFAEPVQEEPKSQEYKPSYSDQFVEEYVNQSLGARDKRGADYEEVQTDLFEDDEMLARAKAEQERKLASHYSGAESSSSRKERAAKKPEPAPEVEPEIEDDIDLGVNEISDVIVINVMAKAGEDIPGTDLLKALTSCGFHHGDMDIFHRYEQHNGQGRLLFSVANVVEPGTFDPKSMDQFTTPGICMFLKLPGPKRPLQAFDVLLDSARRISKLIGADMKDENHSVMTQQTFEHYRQRVVEFERKQLSKRALAK